MKVMSSANRGRSTIFLRRNGVTNWPYTRLRYMLKIHHQASFARHFLKPSLPSFYFHVGILFIIALKICILKARLGGNLAGLTSSRMRATREVNKFEK